MNRVKFICTHNNTHFSFSVGTAYEAEITDGHTSLDHAMIAIIVDDDGDESMMSTEFKSDGIRIPENELVPYSQHIYLKYAHLVTDREMFHMKMTGRMPHDKR